MKVAIIYRPRTPAPMESVPMLMEALGQWVENFSGKFETLEFFAVGGGLVVADFTESADVQRAIAENPFTPFMDVEIMPVLAPSAAMATYGQIAAAMQPAG